MAVCSVAKLASIAAFGIVRAADEGPIFAELQRKLAIAAFRAAARVRSVLTGGENERSELLIERVQHVGHAQLLDFVHGGRKILPEIAQYVLPGEFPIGDLVQFFL